MTGPSRQEKGKYPVTRGSRLLRPGELARRARHTLTIREPRSHPVPSPPPQPLPEYIPSPPRHHTPHTYDPSLDPPPFMIPTPGWHAAGHFQAGGSSSQPTHSEIPIPDPPAHDLHRDEDDDDMDDVDQPPQHESAHSETQRAADGRIIIRPLGRGWTPSKEAADAIKQAIRKQFRGPHHSWSATPQEVRDYWWDRFQDIVTWDPAHQQAIERIFAQRGSRRLTDMLTKARKKGTRPDWIGEEAWAGLLLYWSSAAFLQLSGQNKTNRASARGGAVHTTGRKAHVDVALQLETELGRSVDPDEVFLATHKRRSGAWVDARSEQTYHSYRTRMDEIISQAESTPGDASVDGSQKLQLWKEVAGGVSRGRCYGTADLSANIRHGATTLTQASATASASSSGRSDIIRAQEDAARAREEAARAREEAASARESAARAEAANREMQENMRLMMERMAAWERTSGSGSFAPPQHHTHPDYADDDHSQDEMAPPQQQDRRRRR